MNERSIAGSPIARVAWVAGAVVCLFATENVWIDPWVARRFHHRLPSLVPDPLGGLWYLALMAVGILLILTVLSLALLVRDRGIGGSKKLVTAVLVLGTAALGGKWFLATGGTALLRQGAPAPQRVQPRRTVTLRWKASTTKGVRYNVYRGKAMGVHPDKLNPEPIEGLTFADSTAESGMHYYYVVRAVDAAGHESLDSSETYVEIP